MDRFKVSTRLYALIALFTALMLVVGALGLWGMRSAERSLRTVHDDRAVPLGQLAEIQRSLLEDKVAALHAIADADPAELARLRAQVEARHGRVDTVWAAYLATFLTPEEAQLARRVAATRELYGRDGVLATMAAAQGGHADLANRIVDTTLLPLSDRLSAELGQLIQLQVDVAEAEAVQAKATSQALLAAVIAVTVLGLSGGLFVGAAIVRSLTRALGAEPAEAAALARAVAGGDLTVSVPVRPGDATSLSASLAGMVASLRDTVGEVRRDADSVAVASSQIAQGNLDLSQRTEEQASALQQTAASMEQLDETVRRNADAARQVRDRAAGATETARRGGAVVAQVVETMRGIEGGSRRIAEIIGTIDGIAFQTNILALNAAVEAARAGDQGRGFAVVAGEVRVLAQRSAEAAKEVRALITSSVGQVEQGGALVDQAGATMAEILAAIDQVRQLATEISAASDEQAAGVAQIGQAVTQMDTVTQQNAALVEEGTAAAESLRQQAQQLLAAVSAFRTGAAASPTVATTDVAPAAPAAGWDGVERRGPDRATNVVRPAFRAGASAAARPAPARTGTDGEWAAF